MTSTIMSIPHLPSIWQPLFQGWADACLRLAPVGLGTAKEARAMPIAIPTWINRIWQEYRTGNLTRAARDVLLTLHSYRGRGGVAWPSQVMLGERANCDERTVRRALAAARDLGLVHWTERRIRAGWRWLRTSNLYRFVMPEGPVAPVHLFYGVQKPRAPAAALPDIAAGERTVSKKEALDAMMREAAAAPDLLLARRLAWNEGRLLTTKGG
jgi:hypothetical protein